MVMSVVSLERWRRELVWSSLASSATLSLALRVGSRSRCRRVLEVLASASLPASPRGDAGRRPSLIELLSRALTSCPDPRQPWISSPGVRPATISRWARASLAPPSATVCVHSWTSLAGHPCPRDAISPISFRPRGFSPPRRFPPHMGCRLEACCRPWGSPCFTRSHDGLRVVWIVILAALHPPEDIPPHQHRHGHPW
jgi:hypothetical protein